MFHFALAKIVQMRTPLRVVLQITRDAFRKQNVPGIAAIHHSLGSVDAGACDVGLLIHISDLIDWSAVNPHANSKFGMIFQRLGNFERAKNGSFRTRGKDKCASIAGR